MLEDREAIAVEVRGQPPLGHRHADRVAAAGAQRAGGGLDAGGETIFRVARRLAVELAEMLDVLDADGELAGRLAVLVELLHLREVEERVEQHRGMAGRQHEAVAIGPQRGARIVAQEFGPQLVADGGERHRRAGMAAIRLLHGVHRQCADGVDREAFGRPVLRQLLGGGNGGNGIAHETSPWLR